MLLRVGAESGVGGFVWAFPWFIRACADPWCWLCSFFLSFNLVSSPWMDLGVGGLLLNFIACLFSVGFSHFFLTEVRI